MDRELITDLIEGLNIPGVRLTIQRPENPLDHWLEVMVDGAEKNIDFKVFTYRQILSADASLLVLKKKPDSGKSIHIAPYISGDARKLLKQAQINYLDAAGNVYLISDRFYFFSETGSSGRRMLEPSSREFSKSNLKVLFHLLVQPENLNKPYRYLAEMAKVSLDSVKKTFDRLRDTGELIDLGERKEFLGVDSLLNRWAEGYRFRLKPALRKKTYRAIHPKPFREIHLPPGVVWSGSVAADWMGDRLIGSQALLFTEMPFATVASAMEWVPDPTGEIEIREAFWSIKPFEMVAPPLLVFADLLDGDVRQREEAKLIFNQHVATRA